MKNAPLLTDGQLEALAKALGDTERGLTGSEIGSLLKGCHMGDVGSSLTKWRRLHAVFLYRQRTDKSANAIFRFVEKALEPARFLKEPHRFPLLQELVNQVLMMVGFRVNDKGEIVSVEAAQTIDEVRARTNRIRKILLERSICADVLACCTTELLQENYFHAVLEAAKSICEKARCLSGLTTDGSHLYNEAFSLKKPLIAVNSLQTESERNEQNGLKEMMQGVHHMVRNVRAHEMKINWQDNEQDAVDILQLISFLHKKLDGSVRVPQSMPPQNGS